MHGLGPAISLKSHRPLASSTFPRRASGLAIQRRERDRGSIAPVPASWAGRPHSLPSDFGPATLITRRRSKPLQPPYEHLPSHLSQRVRSLVVETDLTVQSISAVIDIRLLHPAAAGPSVSIRYRILLRECALWVLIACFNNRSIKAATPLFPKISPSAHSSRF